MENRSAAATGGAPFRLLVLNTPLYDFLTATLIEGLNALSGEIPFEWVCRERSNYAPRSKVWSRERILEKRADFDAVLLGTNKEVDEELFSALAPGRITACLDGADQSEFVHRPEEFDVYFKRELGLDTPVPSGVHPCPFASENRWRRGRALSRDIPLSACFAAREGARAVALASLEAIDLPGAWVGPVEPSRWIGIDGVLRGHCSWEVFRQHPFAVGHNRRYHRVLRRSQLSLSVPGMGWDTGRWWEILGSGAGLVSQIPRIRMPHPFEPETHFLSYEEPDQIGDVVSAALAKPGKVAAMRQRAAKHLDRYHTSKERARYVLETLMG